MEWYDPEDSQMDRTGWSQHIDVGHNGDASSARQGSGQTTSSYEVVDDFYAH